MDEMLEVIQEIEQEIDQAMWSFEVHDEIDRAYDIYVQAEIKLVRLEMPTDHSAYPEQQRVLAYCLMRQGNILRQKERPEEALALSEREIIAARASNDAIMLARSLMSNGTNRVVAGELNEGLALLDEARELFLGGDSYDHRQGLGWYWILQADLVNAGIIEKEPAAVLEIANTALEILTPIQNWPGVARGYAARAVAHERLGHAEAAAKDRDEQEQYESKIVSEESG